MKKQDAMSLIEILISTVVLSLVFLGLLNLFVSGRKYLQHSQARIDAGELGRASTDPLLIQVRQSDWDSNDLRLCAPTRISTYISQSGYGLTYTINSDVYTVDNSGVLRGLKTTIKWNEDQSK